MSTQPEKDMHVISYLTLRRWIGILGIALPWACWIANGIVNKMNLLNNPDLAILGPICEYRAEENLKSSISHFYYTASAPLFIGTLVTVAIFLFCYNGHNPKPNDKLIWITDKRVTTLAGIAALGIVVFPTSSEEPITDNFFIFTASEIVGYLHYGSAAIFFILMSILCFVNFRRRGEKGSFGSGEHDQLYKWCGRIILVSIAIVFIYGFFLEKVIKISLPITFIFEAFALAAFVTAWLVKGKLEEAETIRKASIFFKSLSR